MTLSFLSRWDSFSQKPPQDGLVKIELTEGIPIFRATSLVQNRIESLLLKQQDEALNFEEEELNYYEAIDDYLSLVNRVVRNSSLSDAGASI